MPTSSIRGGITESDKKATARQARSGEFHFYEGRRCASSSAGGLPLLGYLADNSCTYTYIARLFESAETIQSSSVLSSEIKLIAEVFNVCATQRTAARDGRQSPFSGIDKSAVNLGTKGQLFERRGESKPTSAKNRAQCAS